MLHPADRTPRWLSPWLALLGVLALAFASVQPAFADARLRAAPVASGSHITFGDLFDNAGVAADRPVARAPVAGQQVVFSAPVLQSRAARAGITWRNGEGVSTVVVSGAAAAPRASASRQPARPAAAEAQPETPAEIAVLANPIARGERIAANDVIWVEAPANTPRDAISDAEDLIGRTARRNLMAEQPVRANDVEIAPLVRRGETVTLVFESGGMRLTMRGRALANGRDGELIRVTNLSSNRTVEAIVESEGVARVMPAATSSTIRTARTDQGAR